MPAPSTMAGHAPVAARRWWRPRLLLFLLAMPWFAALADSPTEYRLKAAFLYNFISFTEWPTALGSKLTLCIYGPDPFGDHLDKYQGRTVAGRSLAIARMTSADTLGSCQVVFITEPVIGNLARALESVRGKPVLTVADHVGAAHDGVVLNMVVEHDRILFEANLGAAHNNGVVLSSKLLRLAKEVIP
ncbi:MAG: YfiR family protein [Pseudomonadota bacterium]